MHAKRTHNIIARKTREQCYKCACREPKSLRCATVVVTDDLLYGQNHGYLVEDHSRGVGSAGRWFNCRVCLLFSVGDLPAQAKVRGFAGTGKAFCGWCEQEGVYVNGLKRSMCLHRTRRFLPPSHALREGERDGPPAARTPETVTHME